MDPRALAYVMLRQGKSLAEIRNALSAQGVSLEEIDAISDELAEPLAERDTLTVVNARQDVRAGAGMIVAAAAIAGLVALSGLKPILYLVPVAAALLGIVRLAGGLAKVRGGKEIAVKSGKPDA